MARNNSTSSQPTNDNEKPSDDQMCNVTVTDYFRTNTNSAKTKVSTTISNPDGVEIIQYRSNQSVVNPVKSSKSMKVRGEMEDGPLRMRTKNYSHNSTVSTGCSWVVERRDSSKVKNFCPCCIEISICLT